MVVTHILARIEIAFWNTIIPLMSLIQRLRPVSNGNRTLSREQAAAQVCLWAAIGLAAGFILGLVGIPAW